MFSILGYVTWFLIGQALKDNKHGDWDWNNKGSHKVIRLLMGVGGRGRVSCLIFCLFTGPQASFLDPGKSLFSLQPLVAWYHFLICSAGTSLIVQALHTSFHTVLLICCQGDSSWLLRDKAGFKSGDNVIKISVEEY